MTPSLLSCIEEYQSLEQRAHVGLDEVTHKATQEVGEIFEAVQSGNKDEVHKEAGDALVNILSASARVGAVPGNIHPAPSKPDSVNLLTSLGKWNRHMQGLRGRYSRDKTSVQEVQKATEELLSGILCYADPNATVADIVRRNTEKFASRLNAYKPDINLADYIENYPNFPKPGIEFKDISPLLASPEAMRYVTFELAEKCKDADVIAGLDARGFLFGVKVASLLGKPFVMIRKKGKLPGETIAKDYSLEYGSNTIEVQKNRIETGDKVALIDDLLATGGTMLAAAELIEQAGWIVNNVVCVISLDEPFLANGEIRKQLEEKYKVGSVLQYS